jgi:4-amino-4-deoxy-L-arabinose transferase-like glycosyltransferase
VIARVLLLLPYRANFDEGVYWASLRSLSSGNAIFSEVFSSQPPLFLLGLLPGYEALGGNLLSARIVVVVFSLVALGAIYVAATGIAGRAGGWIAVLLLASNPLFLGLSSMVAAEVPALAFELLTVALALAATRAAGRRQTLLAGLAGAALAAGTLTKLFAAVAAVPAIIYLLGAARGKPTGAAARLLAAFTAGGVTATVAVLARFWDRRDAMYEQVIGFHLDASAPGSGPLGNLKMLLFPNPQSPLYLLALVVLVLLIRRRRIEVLPPLLWAVASLAFLLRLQPLFSDHHVLLVPPAVLIVALAPLALLRQEAGARYESGAMTVAVAIIAVMAAGTTTMLYQARQPSENLEMNEQMAAELRVMTGPNDLVVSDEPYVVAMADRDVPPQLVDTSYVRLRSGSLDAADIEATIISSGARAVLFTGGRFEELPSLRTWVEARFRLARQFDTGRALYVRN